MKQPGAWKDRSQGEDATRLQRAEMGARLAALEYRSLSEELRSATVFAPPIDPAGDPPAPLGAVLPAAWEYGNLAQVTVPLGRIAWLSGADSLPTIAIHVPDLPAGQLARELADLLGEHHRRPFARLYFCCETLVPVPFLGRYGFACSWLDGSGVGTVAPLLAAKFGTTQVRALVGGAVLWSREQ